MNKAELAKAVQERSAYKMSLACAEDVINCLTDIIKEEVKAGNKVQLMGFGTFSRGKRSKRKARNPRTGKIMTVPAKKVPKFNPGTAFREAVNRK